MKKANIIINKDFKSGEIDKRIYSSFVEHMGRVIYSGIYEPGHPKADEDGFRQDVMEKVKAMGVTGIRYPGGNFVSCYDWRDGVGPIQQRPKRLELAWRSVETNEFGTNEFMKWAGKVNVEPIFALNLGTKGIENAVSFVEYCNIPEGTWYSDLRKEHGVKDPYGIKTWCLGNEMDGDWQIGHKTADEYGRLAEETAKAIKLIDPDIELIACGSSKSDMDTYPEWEAITLKHTYDYVDYIALHQYYGGQEKGTGSFLSQALDMEKYIRTVISVCDYVKAENRSSKELYISLDEWGIWATPDNEVTEEINRTPWRVAPGLNEQIYTMEDTLLFADMLMVMLKYADRIKIACQSLLTNISAAIMTEKNGDVWVQPIYYPFSYMSKHGRGVVLQSIVDSPAYQCELFTKVPYIDTVAVYNEDVKELIYFQMNRMEESIEITCEIQGFKPEHIIEHVALWSEDKKMTNYVNHNAIQPVQMEDVVLCERIFSYEIKPLSWNMIRVKV